MTDPVDPVPSAGSASESAAAGGPGATAGATSAGEAAATNRPIRVLFVCTGNSARSILAEALLRQKGGSDFEVHSAGTEPKGVHPLTLRVLEQAGIPTEGLRSKSVEEYVGQRFDYVAPSATALVGSAPSLRATTKRSTGATRLRPPWKGRRRSASPPSARR